jgi:hypothetical protein
LNVARFNSTSDRLSLGSSALAQNVGGVTVYAIRKWAASPTAARTILSISTNNSVNTRVQMYGGVSSGKSGAGGRRLDANSFAGVNSSSNVSTSVFQIDTAVFDYTNSDLFLYIGSALEASTTSFQTDGSTSNTAANNSNIGAAASGGTQFFNGDIGEILVFHAAHTAAERLRIWTYLRNKWAI